MKYSLLREDSVSDKGWKIGALVRYHHLKVTNIKEEVFHFLELF